MVEVHVNCLRWGRGVRVPGLLMFSSRGQVESIVVRKLLWFLNFMSIMALH